MGRTTDKHGKLTNELKEYVVQRLAAYDSAGAIMRSLREDFGITMTRASIERYDPTRSPRCPQRWRELFFATRQAILDGKAARGAASAAVRLRWREDMVQQALEAKDYAVADRILNSIAREVGDLRQMPHNPDRLSDDDRLRALMALINKVTPGALQEETRLDKTEET